MNEFKDYVTSSAFRLDLSKRMVESLLLVEVGDDALILEKQSSFVWCCQPLQRRGLVKHIMGKGYELTEAGAKVCDLLRLAGFDVITKTKAA